MSTAVDAPSIQNCIRSGIRRAVRSPFKVRIDDVVLPMGLTIAEVGASYFANSLVETSIICQHGSSVLDPNTLVEFTNGSMVLSFRICPLLGGTKHDGVRHRVKQLLTARGVPDDKLGDRVNGFFGKVSPDKIAEHLKGDDNELWDHIKKVATECRYRLILPAELKAHQQKQRKLGQPKDEPVPKKMLRTKNVPSVDAHAITVDPAHFAANGEGVGMIDISRFGPDVCGLCLATPNEARACLANAPRSSDGLALLVVGDGACAFGSIICVPAHLHDGTPITVDATMVQCGDIEISPAIKLPSVVVNQLPSTTIEFVIDRALVPNWADTAVPLHYIGVHVACLRGCNLMSTWAIKSWKGNKPCHYSAASHWHGFFRVSDGLLDQALVRSGVAGIFMSPKTELKRHDPRYVVIPVLNKQITEVHSLIESCNEVIGIVKVNDGYAVRCKREDASAVRTQLLPESAYVETASFDSDQSLYMLKNVAQVGRDELTMALQKLG